MNKQEVEKVRKIFKKHPEIGLVYLFGSRATGKEGPMSDYDFGVYFDLKGKMEIENLRFLLIGELTAILGTDAVDVVALNTAKSSELKYDIIQEGKIIFEKEPFRVVVEPKIRMEYYDFRYMLEKYYY